jgi:thiamine biosynthesis lipoprotein ApbE
VQAALDLVVALMSQWEPESDLSRFNRSAPGVWWPVPGEFAHVIAAALEIADKSGGAFDPGLGRLTDAWGFGSKRSVGHVPAATEATAGRTIEFDAATRRIRREGDSALDLSGIAKGYGVDLAAEWLLDKGVRHFLIEVGGELRGEGHPSRWSTMVGRRRNAPDILDPDVAHRTARSVGSHIGQLSPRLQRRRTALFAQLRPENGPARSSAGCRR